jgi:hypothetical protein
MSALTRRGTVAMVFRRILPVARRTECNRRTYGADAVQRLRFIRHARELGWMRSGSSSRLLTSRRDRAERSMLTSNRPNRSLRTWHVPSRFCQVGQRPTGFIQRAPITISVWSANKFY